MCTKCALTQRVLPKGEPQGQTWHGMCMACAAWGPLWCLRVSCVLHACVAEVLTQGYMHMLRVDMWSAAYAVYYYMQGLS